MPAWPACPRSVTTILLLARDRAHDAERQSLVLEQRPLLDVHLEVSGERSRLARGAGEIRGIAACGTERIGERHPARVAQAKRPGVELPYEGARAEVARPESHPLLVREPDHLERDRQPRAGRVQPRDDLDREQHPERPVVAAGVGHRVEVRTEDQRRRARLVALVATDHVQGDVVAGAHACLAHPPEHELARLGECRRREPARDPPGLLAAGGQRVAPCEDSLGPDRRHQLPR